MFISMSTTFRTLGEFRGALEHFPDDVELTIDPATPHPNDGVALSDRCRLTYEVRCDGVPRLYVSFQEIYDEEEV